MKTGDLYQIMMSTVCRHTGVGELELIDSKKEECVDARYLLVYFLSQFLTDEEISRQTKIPRQSVNRIRNHFDVKINKWSVKNCLHEISSELARWLTALHAEVRLFVASLFLFCALWPHYGLICFWLI